MPSQTGIVKDYRYLNHETGHYHPESPRRLESIYKMLEASDMKGRFAEIAPRFATEEEIEMIHQPSYYRMVAATAGKSHSYLDPDTETSPESFEVARLAVGGFLNTVDSCVKGEVKNAFAFVRPPGHHAEANRAAGFCLFNNVAIGALYAIRKHGMKRILVVDWDLHHGNGTQHSFYEDPRVLYLSTHQYPYYPGTGGFQEIGKGDGKGYTINVPLRTGPGDSEYLKIFRKILQPVALEFKPDMVMLSAGFDIYFQDPLGGMKVTPKGFGYLARVLMDIADACCGGRFVVTLEGGYHIEGLTQSIKVVLNEMVGSTHVPAGEIESVEQKANPAIDTVINTVIAQIKPFWKIFQ
jgi:acetoin utilization deacetylase AcuC-like enzyme